MKCCGHSRADHITSIVKCNRCNARLSITKCNWEGCICGWPNTNCNC